MLLKLSILPDLLWLCQVVAVIQISHSASFDTQGENLLIVVDLFGCSDFPSGRGALLLLPMWPPFTLYEVVLGIAE